MHGTDVALGEDQVNCYRVPIRRAFILGTLTSHLSPERLRSHLVHLVELGANQGVKVKMAG